MTPAFTYTTEYRDAGHGHQAAFGENLIRRIDWDKTYANIPNAQYWWDKAEDVRLSLVEKFGLTAVSDWITDNLADHDTYQDCYRKLLAVENCQHTDVEVTQHGCMHYAGGEVWDTFREEVTCNSCHMDISKFQKPADTTQSVPDSDLP